jgi:DNA-binding beta-propeller fold protein YncE
MKKFSRSTLLAVAGFWIVAASGFQKATPPDRRPLILDRPPVRVIADDFPVFSGITMDEARGELIVTDDAQSSIRTYRGQFESTNRITEPIRQIRGDKTKLGFVCAVAVSPENKELYAVTGDDEWASVFSTDTSGDIAPLRRFTTDHGSAGISLDRKNDELFITGEHLNKVSVFARAARGDGQERRYIQGPATGLADPHGIHVDSAGDEIFVTNHGNWRKTASGEKYASVVLGTHEAAELRPSTGRFLPPSVTVYSRTAKGDAAPIRVIQGARTGLNLPIGVFVDPVSRQIAVANSGDQSVLFFDLKANGDVAPVRMIKGALTSLNGPTGIFIDVTRNEIWVSNWDNHTATVYARSAAGNVRPLRTMRGAPPGILYAGFGNIGDVAFDPKRKEILVPN